MSIPAQLELFDAVDATWAPNSFSSRPPFLLRNGAGGGKRVSAATLGQLAGDFDLDAINAAEDEMRDMGQSPLFMIREGETALDVALDGLGYALVDPVNYFISDVAQIADQDTSGVSAARCDAPLAIQKQIWSQGGVGPERLAVMARSSDPKTFLLGRYKERPVGTVFVAIHGGIAMLHALEVHTDWRRNGIGRALTIACAKWAKRNGAEFFGLLAVKDNTAASRLYENLGMTVAASYHYRMIARKDNSR